MAHPPVDDRADRLPPGRALAAILGGALAAWAAVGILILLGIAL